MKTITVLFIMGLILSLTPFGLVKGQDYYELYKPTMSGPNIMVTSPENVSLIETSSLQLIFNVTGPQIIQLSPNIPNNFVENYGVRNYSVIGRVYFKGDWQIEETILYSNQENPVNFLVFNETVSNIPEGEHQVEITAIGSLRLTVAMFGFEYPTGSSSILVFTANSSQSSNQNSNLLIQLVLTFSVILAIVIIAILLAKGKTLKRYYGKSLI